MDKFIIDVAPASPQGHLTPTLDDLQKHAQLYYQGSDIVWMLVSSGLVLLMVPAICLFYSGASNRQSSLKLFRLPLITAALVGFQWYIWGYSLAFTPAVPPETSAGVSWYGWDADGIALHGILARPVGADGPKIPEIVFEFYESMFASFTAALVCGGTIRSDPGNKFPSSDIPVGRFLIFITFWSLLVYNPIARWTWHWAGWSNQLGVMDFAGGTAVHITSGTTVLAFYVFYAIQTKQLSIFRARREEESPASNQPTMTHQATPGGDPVNLPTQQEMPQPSSGEAEEGVDTRSTINSILIGSDERRSSEEASQGQRPHDHSLDIEPGPRDPNFVDNSPHDVNSIVLGTALLWIGWFGFNGGSALGGNLRAVSACVSTHIAACAGGSCSLLLFWCWNELSEFSNRGQRSRIPSVTHFCDGAIIGLVAITPAAGFVPVWSAGIFGLVSSVVVFFFKKLTAKFLYDKPLYIFAVHGLGGMVGMILTGAFADPDVVGLDGYSTIPDRSRALRVGYQLADVFAGFSYTFCMTMLILYGLKALRSLIRLRWSTGFKKPLNPKRLRLKAAPQLEWESRPEPMAS